MSLPLPPRRFRRVVLHPLMWLAGLAVFAGLLPLALLLAALAWAFWPGAVRVLRLLAFGGLYLGLELIVMPLALGAWLVSGLGWALHRPAFVAFHYRVLAAVLGILVRCGTKAFALTVHHEPRDPSVPDRPLLVLSRHAGPGDSMLLIHQLLSVARRRPRIVLKHTLQWDPMIDLVFHRLPMVFVDPRSPRQHAQLAAIGRLAATMAADDAVLIFPEGRNVSARHRRGEIDRLRRAGREQAARRAERIVHLMPPKARGLQAALAARDDLDVLVLAHAGLDTLHGVPALWHAVTRRKTMHLAWRSVPAAGLPRDVRGLAAWTFAEWERMDAWVQAQRAMPLRNERPSGAGPEPVDPALARPSCR